MSSFTRTGLIPAVTNSSMRSPCQREIPSDLHLNMILPVSFSFRPFSQDHFYINPYPNTCSIMCNHPIVDSTMKKLLNQTKEILKKGQVLCKDIRLKYYNDNDDDYLTDTREHIVVPEILFRHYTQTDSRPPTPTSSPHRFTQTKPESNFTSRRCITPDDNHLSKAPERKCLVLDLRKCLSQSSLILKGSQIEDQKENYSVMSTAIPNYANVIGSRKKKPLLSSEITKYKYFSRKNCHYESRKNVSLKRNNSSLYTPCVEASLQEKSGHTKKYKKKSRKQKMKKCQKKFELNRKNFNENLETEITRNITIENDISIDQNHDSIKSGSLIHSTECSSSVDEHSLNKYDVDKERVWILLKNIDSDTLQKDVGADKYKRFLKENMLTSNNNHIIDVNVLSKKYENDIFERAKKGSLSSVHLSEVDTNQDLPEILTLSPRSELFRIISKRNARFTLPSDKSTLKGMQPLEYLQQHVHISETCRNIYNRIFQMYASMGENNPNNHCTEPIYYLYSLSDLNNALCCALGKNFQTGEWTDILQLLALDAEYVKIDLPTWNGICALCERKYGHRLTFEYLDRHEDPRHEIEMADFEFLHQKLINSGITIELEKILFAIRDS